MESMSDDERRTMGQNGRSWLLREANVKSWQDQFDGILSSVV
jgi:hypothetical protein